MRYDNVDIYVMTMFFICFCLKHFVKKKHSISIENKRKQNKTRELENKKNYEMKLQSIKMKMCFLYASIIK